MLTAVSMSGPSARPVDKRRHRVSQERVRGQSPARAVYRAAREEAVLGPLRWHPRRGRVRCQCSSDAAPHGEGYSDR
eukprot:scaffold303_cov410-Prasinococcus_capsulatus_cf.AAC.15